MADRQALRDLQARLAERLRATKTEDRKLSWLAVECGSQKQGLLFPLPEAGEIFAMAPLMRVSHTHRWFLGVANLRGSVNGVIDLAGFLGLRAAAEAPPEHARLVGLNGAFELNCALLVDSLAGLRNAEQLSLVAADGQPRPAFAGERYRDEQGRVWQELKLSALAVDEAFLAIVQ
ncbi:MAG: chemotaxis protein CheW [Polaromonas sp.]|nr:chemotaxis protein CheW [Polaromonas sp.]